jgi:hypothetical protein
MVCLLKKVWRNKYWSGQTQAHANDTEMSPLVWVGHMPHVPCQDIIHAMQSRGRDMQCVSGIRWPRHNALPDEQLGKGYHLGRLIKQTVGEMKSSNRPDSFCHHSMLDARQPMLLSLVRLLTQALKKLVSRYTFCTIAFYSNDLPKANACRFARIVMRSVIPTATTGPPTMGPTCTQKK